MGAAGERIGATRSPATCSPGSAPPSISTHCALGSAVAICTRSDCTTRRYPPLSISRRCERIARSVLRSRRLDFRAPPPPMWQFALTALRSSSIAVNQRPRRQAACQATRITSRWRDLTPFRTRIEGTPGRTRSPFAHAYPCKLHCGTAELRIRTPANRRGSQRKNQNCGTHCGHCGKPDGDASANVRGRSRHRPGALTGDRARAQCSAKVHQPQPHPGAGHCKARGSFFTVRKDR